MLSYITVLVQFFCLGYLIFTGPAIVNDVFGLVAQLVGIFLGLWAVFTIKIGHFNITPDLLKNARLVTSGPYQYIRHPMYTCLLIITLPMLIALFTPIRLLVWLILLVNLIVKSGYEEKLLITRFPEYEAYRQRSKRLIPFVY